MKGSLSMRQGRGPQAVHAELLQAPKCIACLPTLWSPCLFEKGLRLFRQPDAVHAVAHLDVHNERPLARLLRSHVKQCLQRGHQRVVLVLHHLQ